MQPYSLVSESHLSDLEELVRSTPAGHAIVEVGVYQGGSAWYLANVARDRGDDLHLFDTFTGIPVHDENDSHQVGDFGDTSLEAVQQAIPTANFHVGIFPATMPDTIKSVSFVHSDCDQYRSVRAVISKFWPLLVPGGVMAFDDMDTVGGARAIKEVFPDISQELGWWCVRKPL
jgi:cephalosporin hydroxylase